MFHHRRCFLTMFALMLPILFVGDLPAQTVTELVPGRAPHGARVIFAGSDLDSPELTVEFSSAHGWVEGPIFFRSPGLLETAVPPAAVTGQARLVRGGAALAAHSFTVTPDPEYVRVASIVVGMRTDDLKQPTALQVTMEGSAYLSDSTRHRILRLDSEGNIQWFAGDGYPGLRDGPLQDARFKEPRGIAIDYVRKLLYVADAGNHVIRRIEATGHVTTIAGTGRPGNADGIRGVAQLDQPTGLALDDAGNLYISDAGNHTIRKMHPEGYLTTVAGGGTPGFVDGPGDTAMFHPPIRLRNGL
jgi:DNA-binding beta-propeller fold protein YncE